jgi:biopolymer transport protein ExbB/TolQ
MGATTLAVIVICVLAGTYLYVMALCHLCDVYARRKQEKQEEEERRRKKELKLALEQVEMRRKQEMGRRKQLARARTQKQRNVTRQAPRKTAGPQAARAAQT